MIECPRPSTHTSTLGTPFVPVVTEVGLIHFCTPSISNDPGAVDGTELSRAVNLAALPQSGATQN
jgi:hypothetical protein